ncbi:hypothetical protein ACJ41O_011197 [Fusarium nematophilum]
MVQAAGVRITAEDAEATTMQAAATIMALPKVLPKVLPKAPTSIVVSRILLITTLLRTEDRTRQPEAILHRSNGAPSMAIPQHMGIRRHQCPPATTILTTRPNRTPPLNTPSSRHMAAHSHTLIKVLLRLLANPSGVAKDSRLRAITAMVDREVATMTVLDQNLQCPGQGVLVTNMTEWPLLLTAMGRHIPMIPGHLTTLLPNIPRTRAPLHLLGLLRTATMATATAVDEEAIGMATLGVVVATMGMTSLVITNLKKKRKMNTLGLTPGMDSESEDDEGEEKILTDLIGQETLHSVKDVAAFLSERKKHFPTKARVEAKKAAELAQNGEDKASSLEKQADKLRRQLRKVESSIKRKREQGDEGDEMRDPSEESSDDEPEVMSTRSHVAPPPPPPAKKADVSKHCKYYSTGGTCGKKGKCRFVHDPEVREAAMKEREANNGRLTIQQRLILNDKEQEDLTVLQSIQYLREKGLMKPADPAEAKEETKPEKLDLPAQPPQSSLLPAASASLPPPPIKREPALPRRNPPPSIIPSASSNSAQGIKHYQGWLLRPYGSSSGKSSKSDDLP